MRDNEVAKKILEENREKKRNLLTALNATIKKSPMQRKQEVLESVVCWIIEENIPLSMVEMRLWMIVCMRPSC